MDEESVGKAAVRFFLGLFFAAYAIIGYLQKSVHIIGMHAVLPPIADNYGLAAISIGILSLYFLLSLIRKLESYTWPLLLVSSLLMFIAIMS